METTTETREVWTSPSGVACYLSPVSRAESDRREREYLSTLSDEELDEWYSVGGDEGWYPDFPGEREPLLYELIDVDTGVVVDSFVSRPYEPFNWYDAVSDELTREGWEGPPPTEEDLAVCEHGLSARLCSGPGHY